MYSSILSLTSALDEGWGSQYHAPSALPREDQVPNVWENVKSSSRGGALPK